MEILTSVRRLNIRFKSLVNDFVYSFGRAALLLLVEVYNHIVPVWERRRIRVNLHQPIAEPRFKHIEVKTEIKKETSLKKFSRDSYVIGQAHRRGFSCHLFHTIRTH